MRIEFNPLFEEALFGILEYIEYESPSASIRFEEALLEHLEGLTLFPYKFRKSIYHDDEHILGLWDIQFLILWMKRMI